MAKLPSFGGNGKVLTAVPDIRAFDLSRKNCKMDFVILGCDGIFDVLSNEELISWAWHLIERCPHNDIHLLSKWITNELLLEAMRRRSLDNVTIVFLGLRGLEDYLRARPVRKLS